MTSSGLEKVGVASSAPSLGSVPPPSLLHLSRLREPSFVWGKHGLSAPTTPTMPCQRGAENYSSHEAAHRDPPTPRGLQSHVQASLVNSARARVASERAATKVPGSAGIPAGRAGPSGSAHTHTLTRTRPRPHSSPAPCKNAHYPAPRPPHARSRGVAAL